MIDFEKINDELMEISIEKKDTFELKASEQIIKSTVNLLPFIEASENYQVSCKATAEICLSMSLQARKMRQALDKSRSEIIKPHFDFQKAVNKLSKDFENKLVEIEKSLSGKVVFWLENPECFDIEKINVEDGCLSKKTVVDFEIMSLDDVPREFLMIDTKKIELAIKNKIKKIDGVRFFNRSEITLRIKN